MRIRNHKLVDHWYRMSRDVGDELESVRFIVMHYTAGGSGVSSRDYMLKSPTQKMKLLGARRKVYASAHVIVDRDGSIWQIVPFNRKARHAGLSSWKGLQSLNRCSIGIEIANYGWLDPQGDGSYKRADTPRFDAGDVTLSPMPFETRVLGWENYTGAQLEATERLARVLTDTYPTITEILGHEEIAPRRKFDPGPAFPMQHFRNLLDSRGIGALEGEPDDRQPEPERYVTTARLNIRGGAGLEFEKLDESPLASNTPLEFLDRDGVWTKVRVPGADDVIGWVHSDYLRLV